jgi:hypothetical protein
MPPILKPLDCPEEGTVEICCHWPYSPVAMSKGRRKGQSNTLEDCDVEIKK